VPAGRSHAGGGKSFVLTTPSWWVAVARVQGTGSQRSQKVRTENIKRLLPDGRRGGRISGVKENEIVETKVGLVERGYLVRLGGGGGRGGERV